MIAKLKLLGDTVLYEVARHESHKKVSVTIELLVRIDVKRQALLLSYFSSLFFSLNHSIFTTLLPSSLLFNATDCPL